MKNKITYLSISILTLTTVLAGVSLTTGGALAATDSATTSVTVSNACGFSTSGYSSSIDAVAGHTYDTEDDTSKTVATIVCNTSDGFVVSALGADDSTVLAGTVGGNIASNTNTTGGVSGWAFKVTSTTGSTISPYTAYSAVPAEATPIINFAATSGTLSSGTFRTDYRVYVAATQATDTYTGGVEYIVTAN